MKETIDHLYTFIGLIWANKEEAEGNGDFDRAKEEYNIGVNYLKDYIKEVRQQDRDELLKIADSGEFEDMRRELINYYK